jgi:uncharacterized membrane protein YedE/YeeE
MLDTLSEPVIVAWIGLAGGVVLGLAARIGRFCTLGALEDFFYGDSVERLRMWGIAIGLSIMGSFAAQALGWVDLTQAIYLSAAWNPWASILGGLTFGYGMALAGNCGYGALARLGGGDIRAFIIVLVMGIFAYMTIAGPLAYLRIWLFGGGSAAPTPPSIAFALSHQFGLSLAWIGMGIGFFIFALAAASRSVLQNPNTLLWGALVAGRNCIWLDWHAMGCHPWFRRAATRHPYFLCPHRRKPDLPDECQRQFRELCHGICLGRLNRRISWLRIQRALPLGGL